ncbi:hypothetical protein [Burkholderia sp. BDU5]|uniref:hypothetical protein n=1 Tax=Burkholderia sp. BDU5 TaxID=1385590 RepID=UPI00075547DF|nr:hypothetical protein [Burkholderia sp. BDU5]KVE35696.1 hypothetical protein WS69_13675 [Burkholderia sp. BDU5]
MQKPAWLEKAAKLAAETKPQARVIVPEVVSERTVHVDGDYLAYRCAGSDECPPGIARKNVRDKVDALREMSGARRALVHLSMPGGNKGERYLIATIKPYQGQRTHSKRPANWDMLRAYLETHDPKLNPAFAVARWSDREADDGFAVASYGARDPSHECAIASPDKDMRMLAGLHIDFHDYTLTIVPKGTYELLGPYNGLVYGHKWFWLQTLMGDTADHIPGLPKAEGKLCGEKTAEKYLKGTTCNEEAFEVVSRLYEGTYGDEWADRFVEQAALLWLRGGDKALLHDFIRVVPLTPEIEAAAKRLNKRVRIQRAEIDSITAKAHAAEAEEGAA